MVCFVYTHYNGCGETFGSNQIVACFMKGVFESCQPTLKYITICVTELPNLSGCWFVGVNIFMYFVPLNAVLLMHPLHDF